MQLERTRSCYSGPTLVLGCDCITVGHLAQLEAIRALVPCSLAKMERILFILWFGNQRETLRSLRVTIHPHHHDTRHAI